MVPAALGLLIEVQAQAAQSHLDPQPTHGRDDEHGHAPVLPPVVLPPVVTPPGPHPGPHPAPTPSSVSVPGDPAVAGRARAMLDQRLADIALSTLNRNAFVAAAAERQAADYMGEAGVALSLLGVLESGMRTFDAGWGARAVRA